MNSAVEICADKERVHVICVRAAGAAASRLVASALRRASPSPHTHTHTHIEETQLKTDLRWLVSKWRLFPEHTSRLFTPFGSLAPLNVVQDIRVKLQCVLEK